VAQVLATVAEEQVRAPVPQAAQVAVPKNPAAKQALEHPAVVLVHKAQTPLLFN
jgi:hypothetical protein